jgi:hypothetical protein
MTIVFVVTGLAVLLLLPLWYVWRKGRRFTSGDVFRASRMSAGNRLFPTQVAITPTAVVHYTPQWIGKLEHSIHMAHVASVRIDTNLMFSNVLIETTGGHSPIQCRGHHKRDAIRMKELIEQHQSAYYRSSSERSGSPGTFSQSLGNQNAPAGADPRGATDRRNEA